MNDLKPVRKQPGGTGCNTAAGLASFEAKVAINSFIAHDNMWQQYINDIKRYGVDSFVGKISSTEKTGVIIVIISPNSNRTMLAYPGVSQQVPSNR